MGGPVADGLAQGEWANSGECVWQEAGEVLGELTRAPRRTIFLSSEGRTHKPTHLTIGLIF